VKPFDARALYPYFLAIPTRWMDNDVYGHLNNVVYYSFFDTVINTYLIEQASLDIHSGGVIGLCVESQCRYAQPLAFPGAVDAGLRVAHLGRSSVRYEIGLFAAGREDAAAEGHFVHVFVDRASRKSVPLPTDLREALGRLHAPNLHS
jgi:acyl-CoA thioester hydrolase